MPRWPKKTEKERFDERVDDSLGSGSCWPWTGKRSGNGYGQFRLGTGHGREKVVIAARYALERKLGRPLGAGMCACHTCDNPICVNPGHLFEGTQADNVADRVAKGRSSHGRDTIPQERRRRGEAHGMAKLTDASVREIRAMREEGYLLREIAQRHDVSLVLISKVVRREIWEHVS